MIVPGFEVLTPALYRPALMRRCFSTEVDDGEGNQVLP